MSQTVSLSLEQLRNIVAWAERLEDAGLNVDIEVSHASGIGPSVTASITTAPGEGVFKDFTELDKW